MLLSSVSIESYIGFIENPFIGDVAFTIAMSWCERCLNTQACSNFTCSIHVHYRNANMAFTMNLVSANRSAAIRCRVLQATVLMKCLLLTELFLNLSKRTNFCRYFTAGMFAVKQENSPRISTDFKAHFTWMQ